MVPLCFCVQQTWHVLRPNPSKDRTETQQQAVPFVPASIAAASFSEEGVCRRPGLPAVEATLKVCPPAGWPADGVGASCCASPEGKGVHKVM